MAGRPGQDGDVVELDLGAPVPDARPPRGRGTVAWLGGAGVLAVLVAVAASVVPSGEPARRWSAGPETTSEVWGTTRVVSDATVPRQLADAPVIRLVRRPDAAALPPRALVESFTRAVREVTVDGVPVRLVVPRTGVDASSGSSAHWVGPDGVHSLLITPREHGGALHGPRPDELEGLVRAVLRGEVG